MYVPTFRELVGDEDTFFAEYFNRRPLLRRGALRASPRDLLSLDDLDAMLTSEAIRPPYFDVAKNGRQVQRALYTEPVIVQEEHVADRVLPDRVAMLVRSGATLTWGALNHHRPNLRALARIMTTVFASRAEIVGLLTPAGRRGLSPHHDPTDVFVIQVHGSKLWKVWPLPDPRPGEGGRGFDEAALGPPVLEATLEPGDMLYMPYNSPHVAQAGDRMSLHVSVTVKARRWADLLQSVVDRIVLADPEFWENPRLRDEEAAVRRLGAVAEALAERLLLVDPEAEIERLIAEGTATYGIEEAHHLRDLAAADQQAPASRKL
ncbi:JmjC domain-containing protein [Sphaerisporangium aureirubrum]|uniref:JmjC domain-containing protein n=1 Tax=Sphaerisporangium aureirubrum TaxID=1544736 RepID=A0ABW1NWJ5_9ACTN